MDEARLIEELRARAAADAWAFREKFGAELPNGRWIENSFTAALPLARDASGFDPDPSAHPRLFDAYQREVARALGMTLPPRPDSERDRNPDGEQLQEPTPGEG